MLAPYRHVLALPGTLRFSAAGAVARFPMAVVGIGTTLLLTASGRSYTTAGIVVAAFSLAQAAANPLVSKAVDRRGQRRVMLPLVVAHATALAGLAAAGTSGAATTVLVLLALIAGATMGSMGALVRARWSNLLGGDPRLHTALSLESVVDDMVFILGPTLAALLVTQAAPAAALLTAAGAGLVGGLLLLAQPGEPPARTKGAEARSGSVLAVPALRVVVATFLLTGVVFGAIEVSIVASADEAGSRGAAGVLLTCLSAGSLLGGVAYGVRRWRWRTGSRFVLVASLLGALSAPLLFASGVAPLAAALVLVGFAISPLMISGNALVEEAAPPGRLTEGFAWLGTALGVGVSMGAALTGHVVDTAGAGSGFVVVVVGGALVAACALAGRTRLLGAAQGPSGALPSLTPEEAAALIPAQDHAPEHAPRGGDGGSGHRLRPCDRAPGGHTVGDTGQRSAPVHTPQPGRLPS